MTAHPSHLGGQGRQLRSPVALVDQYLRGQSVRRFLDRTRSRFWVIPTASVVISIGLAIALIVADHHIGRVQDVFLYPGPPSGARSLLSSIVTAMITTTGMIFSVSIVVLQLTNGQFSSRVVRVYLRDTVVQVTLGLFLATFVYSMVVQRSVRGTGVTDGFVPQIAVTVALVLVVMSTGMFIHYVSHISNMVRVATVVSTIADSSRQLLDELYPEQRAGVDGEGWALRPLLRGAVMPPSPTRTLRSPRAGVLVSVNSARLVRLACERDCTLQLIPRMGDFVPLGAPLLEVSGEPDGPQRADSQDDRNLVRAVALDTERTMEQDLAFGFRQLVDIAERALSPSTNDPTTACQCLDVMHDLLRRLASRPFPDGVHRDADGTVRLVVPQYSYADYLELALSELWHYGSQSAQVPGRVANMLADLESVVRGDDHEAVRRWQERVKGAVPVPVAPTSRRPDVRAQRGGGSSASSCC